jgi:pimeloyl-ACP methyl ester carboxylesterase
MRSVRPSPRGIVELLLAVLCIAWACVVSTGPALAAEPELVTESLHVPSSDPGIELYMRHKRPRDVGAPGPQRTLLYVHGATYPAETAFDLALDGTSWMDYIARRGFDVWLVDVRGYGGSTRPPEMAQPVAVRDVAAAVEYVARKSGVDRLVLLGWSWGTTIMGGYAAQHPERVERLVLYAPLWLRTAGPSTIQTSGPLGAYRTVTVEGARKRWLTGVAPDKQERLIPAGWFDAWAQATFATDADGAAQQPPVLRAPNGVVYDVQNFWSKGQPLYDPARITAPVLLIHAEWDADTPAYMSQALFPLFTKAAWKRYVVLGEGTHSIIMERNRMHLFREVQAFLEDPGP